MTSFTPEEIKKIVVEIKTLDDVADFLSDKDWWITSYHTEFTDDNVVLESQYVFTQRVPDGSK